MKNTLVFNGLIGMLTLVKLAELGYGNQLVVDVKATLLVNSVQPEFVGHARFNVLPPVTENWTFGGLVFTRLVTVATVILPFELSVLVQV